MTNSLVSFSPEIARIKNNVRMIHELLKDVLIENEHYGVIPGTKKMTLYKQGSEKLLMLFRLCPQYKVEKTDFENGHREITVTSTIINIDTQEVISSGVGSCTTMESKYRYRKVPAFEILDEEIPRDAKEKKDLYYSRGFGMKKIDGVGWKWVKYGDAERQENPDIADLYNTVLKMAKKRSLADGVLSATAASDIFTQDYEPEPIQYITESQAIQCIRLCESLIDLEELSVRYKEDHRMNITGWSTENWKSIVASMKIKKDSFEESINHTLANENRSSESEPNQGNHANPLLSEDETLPGWL